MSFTIKTMRMETDILLAKVIENLELYNVEYRDTCEDYKTLSRRKIQDCITELADLMKDKEADSYDIYHEFGVISQGVLLAPPTNHCKDYQRAIQYLDLTNDKVIELNHQQFEQLVMNNWEWSENFNNVRALYKSSL